MPDQPDDLVTRIENAISAAPNCEVHRAILALPKRCDECLRLAAEAVRAAVQAAVDADPFLFHRPAA